MPMIVTTHSYNKDKPKEYVLLLEIDETSGDICRSQRVDTSVSPPRAKGRIKPGLRGIAKYRDELYIMVWNSIVVVNLCTFEVSKIISHRWMSDLHGIYVNEDRRWVTSTFSDALILCNFDAKPINICWFLEKDVDPELISFDRDLDWRLIGKEFRGFNLFHRNHVEVKRDTVYVTGHGGNTKNGRIHSYA